jgi:lysophospholipase L1-like esterase
MHLPALVLTLALFAQTNDPTLIAPLDTIQFQAPKDKATVSLVDGKVGKANRFEFAKDAKSIFCTSKIRGTPEWDQAAGLSMWVQGDGSDSFGGLQFIYDNDYEVRYDVAFPIKSKEWTKVTIAWSDLVPVLPGAKLKPLGGPDGNRPSKISAVSVGKWWYWRQFPECSFALDEIRLEPKIDRDLSEHRPTGVQLARTLAKLKAKQPITIVTMGDSLTDVKHWSNRKTNWVAMFKERAKEKYGSNVTIVNSALGGNQLRQGVILIPTWLPKAPAPDLVTINFGANDWDAGMRGDQFQRSCVDAIDRVRRATGGKADVLVMTTLPGPKQWDTMAELADAGRKAAKERNAGLADTDRAFHDAGKTNRERLFAKDPQRGTPDVHLGLEGQRVVAETVLDAIEAAGK